MTKSLSSNLLKQYYVSVDFEKTRVIDTNELAQKKIAELNQKMRQSVKDRGLDEFEAEFTDGIEAVRVAELLDDTEANVESMENNVFKPVPQYEGPSEEEIQQMINERLQEADRQAEEIVMAARDEAEAIRNQAYTEGMQQGYDDGIKMAMAEYQTKEEELVKKEKLLEKEYETKVNYLEPMFVDTITDVYEQIFHTDLSGYHDILVYLVESIMKKSDEDMQFIVHVSPKDYQKVAEKKADLLSSVSRENIRLEVVEDVTVANRQCIIETENGVFDCGIDTQLEELKKRFKLLAYQKN